MSHNHLEKHWHNPDYEIKFAIIRRKVESIIKTTKQTHKNLNTITNFSSTITGGVARILGDGWEKNLRLIIGSEKNGVILREKKERKEEKLI